MSKYTPKPWIRTILSDGVESEIVDEDGRIIATTSVDAPETIEEHEANGDLLAAAPDLLEELKAEITKRCGKGSECEVCGGNGSTLSYHSECCAGARAAIARVEGKD